MNPKEAIKTLKQFCRKQDKCDECEIKKWCSDVDNWGTSPRLWELHEEEE